MVTTRLLSLKICRDKLRKAQIKDSEKQFTLPTMIPCKGRRETQEKAGHFFKD